MSGVLRIVPIVEGHGDERAVPILLRRLCGELDPPFALDVLRPIRVPRSKLAKVDELGRAVQLGCLKLAAAEHGAADHDLVLVLADADEEPACEIGPRWLAAARRDDFDVSVVLAAPEYETWFVAAAESLAADLDLDGTEVPADPEHVRAKKKWVADRFRGSYSETIDQPRLTQAMDLVRCRERSPSFDKLCRELERRRDQLQ